MKPNDTLADPVTRSVPFVNGAAIREEAVARGAQLRETAVARAKQLGERAVAG